MKKLLFSILLAYCILISGCTLPVVRSIPPKGDLNDKMIYSLPKGMIRLAFYNDDKKDVFLMEPVFVPDPLHYYALESCSNPAYDDEVQVSVDTNGLLKAINVTTTSQVGAIIMELVETAKQAAKLATLHAPKRYFDIIIDNPEETLAEDNYSIEKNVVDLKNSERKVKILKDKWDDYVKKLNEAKNEEDKLKYEDLERQAKVNYEKARDSLKNKPILNNVTKYTKYEEYGIHYISLNWLATKGNEIVNIKEGSASRSVYYRPLLPCKIKVVFGDNDDVYEKILYLPNKAPIIAFDINRPAFTKKVTKLTFSNGVLTEVYLNKPSELLAGLKIPSEILKSIAGMPLELLQFRVNYADEYNKLLQAQIQEIQNKQQLMQLQLQGK